MLGAWLPVNCCTGQELDHLNVTILVQVNFTNWCALHTNLFQYLFHLNFSSYHTISTIPEANHQVPHNGHYVQVQYQYYVQGDVATVAQWGKFNGMTLQLYIVIVNVKIKNFILHKLYGKQVTLALSKLVSITITEQRYWYIICQKSSNVSGSGPWVAINRETFSVGPTWSYR